MPPKKEQAEGQLPGAESTSATAPVASEKPMDPRDVVIAELRSRLDRLEGQQATKPAPKRA
jgi:hypothetical protein